MAQDGAVRAGLDCDARSQTDGEAHPSRHASRGPRDYSAGAHDLFLWGNSRASYEDRHGVESVLFGLVGAPAERYWHVEESSRREPRPEVPETGHDDFDNREADIWTSVFEHKQFETACFNE